MLRKVEVSAVSNWRKRHRFAYDAIALAVYTLIVYAWALGIVPLGRDYPLMVHGADVLPGFSAAFLRVEMACFGTAVLAYRLVNLLLLYVSMLCVYVFTNRVVGGLQWLGNLAAVLFMANPVHTESILNITGAVDLLPAAAALGFLTAYTSGIAQPSRMRTIFAIMLFVVAVLIFPSNLPLLLVPLLYEWLVVRSGRPWGRLLPLLLVTLAALFVHRSSFAGWSFSPAHMWVPLYFLFYPIGFLPETAQRLNDMPALGWLAAVIVAALLVLILRKAQCPALLFALLAMLAVRLAPNDTAIDPVHLTGGGQLLLANALFDLGVSALFLRMMDHARWKIPLVAGSTLLGLVFLGMQAYSNLAWRHAGREVEAFQKMARADAAPMLGLLPDYRQHLTAPMMLSETIAYDTPFSRMRPHVSLLPLHHLVWGPPELRIERWTSEEGIVAVSRGYLDAAAPRPYGLAKPGGTHETDAVRIERLPGTATDDTVRLRICPRAGTLPMHTLPVDVARRLP